jgi:hypothetical protein
LESICPIARPDVENVAPSEWTRQIEDESRLDAFGDPCERRRAPAREL